MPLTLAPCFRNAATAELLSELPRPCSQRLGPRRCAGSPLTCTAGGEVATAVDETSRQRRSRFCVCEGTPPRRSGCHRPSAPPPPHQPCPSRRGKRHVAACMSGVVACPARGELKHNANAHLHPSIMHSRNLTRGYARIPPHCPGRVEPSALCRAPASRGLSASGARPQNRRRPAGQ